MVATGEEMAREKNSSRSGKSQGISPLSGKIYIFGRSQGKMKSYKEYMHIYSFPSAFIVF